MPAPAPTVWEVRQRSMLPFAPNEEREFGLYTDDMMADQAISVLYHYAWQDIMNGVDNGWYDPSQFAAIKLQGFDDWFNYQKTDPLPMFFKVPRVVHNRVPETPQAFGFYYDTGTYPVTVHELMA